MSLADLNSPIAVKKAIAEHDRLGRDTFLSTYGYGPAREYLLRHKGNDYDSKAIAGVAYGYQFPEEGPLMSEDFSGGIGSGGAARKLSQLGFEIVGLSSPDGWSLEECERTVAAYFQCVQMQNEGKPFKKADVYRKVAAGLNNRSAKAVEYKFQNIEKVLEEEDLPRLGMSTKANYQSLLRPVVLDYIREHPEPGTMPPTVIPPAKPWDEVVVDPPKGRSRMTERRDQVVIAKIRVAEQDAESKKLGRKGEEWILKLEQDRLRDKGRGDLAEKVVWVSEREGDGAGYDIRSFDDDGTEICIEVKTTNGGKTSDFLISANEVAVSDRVGTEYRLYRVFNFSREPMVYVLKGPLSSKLLLTPRSYSARYKA